MVLSSTLVIQQYSAHVRDSRTAGMCSAVQASIPRQTWNALAPSLFSMYCPNSVLHTRYASLLPSTTDCSPCNIAAYTASHLTHTSFYVRARQRPTATVQMSAHSHHLVFCLLCHATHQESGSPVEPTMRLGVPKPK